MKLATILLASSSIALFIPGCGGGGGGDDHPDAPHGVADARPDSSLPPDSAPDAPTGNTVTVSIDAQAGTPFWLVYQDGDGPWTLIPTDGGGGDYMFQVTNGRYGVATICADPSWQEMDLTYSTVAEQSTVFAFVSCGFTGTPPVTHNVSGTVTGLSGKGYIAQVGFVQAIDSTTATTGTYSLDPSEGTTTLYYGRYHDLAHAHVDRLDVRRHIDISSDMIQDVAFLTDGAATVSRPATITGILDAGETILARSRFRTSGAVSVPITSDSTAPLTVDIPDPPSWSAGDADTIRFYASAPSGKFRQIQRVFTTAASVPAQFALELPDSIADISLASMPNGGHPRFTAGWQVDPTAAWAEVDLFSDGFDDASCDGNLCFPGYVISTTPGWFAGATDLSLTTPDPAELIALGAWDPRLDMRPGNPLFWELINGHTDTGYDYTAGKTGEITP